MVRTNRIGKDQNRQTGHTAIGKATTDVTSANEAMPIARETLERYGDFPCLLVAEEL